MTERLNLLTRRVLLGLAAIAPFALLAGRSRRARAQATCDYPDDLQRPDVQKAGETLWAAFEKGMDDMRFFYTTELEPGLKDDRTLHHGEILCNKWDRYMADPGGTENCCRLAGKIAEVLRKHEGTNKVTKYQFLAAVEAVKEWQRERNAALGITTPTGASC